MEQAVCGPATPGVTGSLTAGIFQLDSSPRRVSFADWRPRGSSIVGSAKLCTPSTILWRRSLAWSQRGEAASRHPWPTQLCRRVKCLPSLGRIQYVCTQQQKQPVITVHSTAGWSSEDRRGLARFAHVEHHPVVCQVHGQA